MFWVRRLWWYWLCAGLHQVRPIGTRAVVAGLTSDILVALFLETHASFLSDTLGNVIGSKDGNGAASPSAVLGFRPKNVTPEMVRLFPSIPFSPDHNSRSIQYMPCSLTSRGEFLYHLPAELVERPRRLRRVTKPE